MTIDERMFIEREIEFQRSMMGYDDMVHHHERSMRNIEALLMQIENG